MDQLSYFEDQAYVKRDRKKRSPERYKFTSACRSLHKGQLDPGSLIILILNVLKTMK